MPGESYRQSCGGDDPARGEPEEDVHQGARRAAGAAADHVAERALVRITDRKRSEGF